MTKYTAILNTNEYQAKVNVYNVVTACSDATVTATNSDGDTIGQTTAPSGGTGNIPISDSEIRRSDATVIAEVPATDPYTVADSVVQINQQDGTPISTNNVMAATNVTLLVPNPPVCPTLDELVDSSTSEDVVDAIELAGKECSVLTGLLPNLGSGPYIGQFAPVSTSSLSVFVNGNTIYVLNNNQIDLYNATTFAFEGSVLGFNRAAEIAFGATTYVVVNFGNNTARLMDIATNTEITSFSVVSNPFSVCFNPDATLIYVAAFSAAGSLSIYNTSGVLQGTVSGFDTLIIELRAVGTEYWVLTGTGTIAGSTQRVRKMRFSDNTQVSTHSLGTVITIGQIRAMVIVDSLVYVSVTFGNQNVYKIICYELDFTSPVTFTTGLVGQASYGLTYNPNKCDQLIMINPNAELCFNIQL
jgi:hypothetical protein